MGITGLIPFVKNSTKEVDLRSLFGKVIAVDAYCLLHRGAFACADKLVKGEKTDLYVTYCMKYVNLFLDCGLKPIFVFDGRGLPSKAEVEKKRRDSRKAAKVKGIALLAEGNAMMALKCFQSAVDVTSSMALDLIQACRSVNVDCIVAPHEADAQLAYLSKSGIAHIVMTEDSDLMAFGCEKVLFKLTLEGRGILYDKAMLNESLGSKASQFNIDRFRQMCVLSGCDYLASLPGIGLKTAFQFFSKLKPTTDVYSALSLMPNYLKKPSLVVPKDYREKFEQADNTFLYQLVYDPISREIVPLNPYPPGKDASHYPYAGVPSTPGKAFSLAVGNLNVNTLEAEDFYDPDNHEATLRVRSSYSWSNSVKRASHASIWKRGYSTQDAFKSPKKSPKKSPRKRLAFTAERTFMNSFLTSPGKKRESEQRPDSGSISEARMILTQYRPSPSPQTSPSKPKKMKIESAYSSVEWTPTKIRKKESGKWLDDDEESPIRQKFEPFCNQSERVEQEQEISRDETQENEPVSKSPFNPFLVASNQAQPKRLSYSAISLFEKMRMSRTEDNQIVVTSKYFSSTSNESSVDQKRKGDEDRSCFDYLEANPETSHQSSVASIQSLRDSPTTHLSLITPEKSYAGLTSGADESPVFERTTRDSVRKLTFKKDGKKQVDLFQSFSYQKKASSVKVQADDVLLIDVDSSDMFPEMDTPVSSSLDDSPAQSQKSSLSQAKAERTPLKLSSALSRKPSNGKKSNVTSKSQPTVQKQMNLFEMFGRRK